MQPYDQKKSDPAGFVAGIAAVVGLAGMGLVFDGHHALGAVAITLAVGLLLAAGDH